ncbi:hypothetical protein THAOC_06148 [Thalassiosira oceanica]|uniref:Uncharacterized protein n=1 Tax=Thalassiosira oceanica TaxID=159749 RepID=K0TFH8_THAOC|nr:hypothetical protein THAOC_06148 [Thalassiosira oceanica]|eukprot:EJK72331.1 hypothetical protein THAOC_06148 [Thalassiosira oceanica]
MCASCRPTLWLSLSHLGFQNLLDCRQAIAMFVASDAVKATIVIGQEICFEFIASDPVDCRQSNLGLPKVWPPRRFATCPGRHRRPRPWSLVSRKYSSIGTPGVYKPIRCQFRQGRPKVGVARRALSISLHALSPPFDFDPKLQRSIHPLSTLSVGAWCFTPPIIDLTAALPSILEGDEWAEDAGVGTTEMAALEEVPIR